MDINDWSFYTSMKKKNESNEKRVPYDSEGRRKSLSDPEIGNPINRIPRFYEGHWLVKNVDKGAVVIKSNNQSVLADAMKVRRNSDNTCNCMHQILNLECSSYFPSLKMIWGVWQG
ncbi:hypothetical protein KP509_21G017800 [Ceratopteris richardii]|uniref:Uncharacterized protein n=2 Tax=Ceratopteris richardii TaxID=49495 RepID=A0A8T2S7U5_CERRI|nr:hypothetical protein KP509_21G017800 [Ceratopteris richardii]